MAKKDLNTQNKNSSGVGIQAHMDVAEVQDSTIILRDGSLRAVIVVSSTNFSLKSADEQNALIDSYQSFLNAIDFPIQILMQSRKLDIHSYLDKLRSVMQQQTSELLRLQTQEYIEYISKLIEFASIMNKTFYIIVPYSPFVTKEGLLAKVGNLLNPVKNISLKKSEFQAHKEQLQQRCNQVTNALGSMGLRTILLETEELIELLYNSYNFDTASQIRINKIEELDLVKPQ
jgi:type IV secretory pathway VirB4 component